MRWRAIGFPNRKGKAREPQVIRPQSQDAEESTSKKVHADRQTEKQNGQRGLGEHCNHVGKHDSDIVQELERRAG